MDATGLDMYVARIGNELTHGARTTLEARKRVPGRIRAEIQAVGRVLDEPADGRLEKGLPETGAGFEPTQLPSAHI